jgi:hypothetical protein
VLSVRINHLVKPFLLQACMSLFPTLVKYFIYSHLPYFLHIAAMPCYSGDEKYFDEGFFYACKTPGHLPVARWCPFCCLVFSGHVIRYDVINTSYAIYSIICRFMCET